MAAHIEVWLEKSSKPMVYYSYINTYTKGNLFCVMLNDGTVYKYPIDHIFRIVEFSE